jgi:hypothetical protein
MSFCEHCEGQRFDRARVLRALRRLRKELPDSACRAAVDAALTDALDAVRELDLPHLGPPDDDEDLIVH